MFRPKQNKLMIKNLTRIDFEINGEQNKLAGYNEQDLV